MFDFWGHVFPVGCFGEMQQAAINPWNAYADCVTGNGPAASNR